jgi:hypothetical protein
VSVDREVHATAGQEAALLILDGTGHLQASRESFFTY